MFEDQVRMLRSLGSPSVLSIAYQVEDELSVDEADGNESHSRSGAAGYVAVKVGSEMLDGVPDDLSGDGLSDEEWNISIGKQSMEIDMTHLGATGDDDSDERGDDETERKGDCEPGLSTMESLILRSCSLSCGQTALDGLAA